ncbi:MAG: recombination protein O N-terminal domain-containing protein [Phycisphaeraceae bacterium]|nr:recombination protein O N-terminal domain-containing protein [Phycisphaeraceae bacterium]
MDRYDVGMPRIREPAICLRLIDWSETSQIVAVFTRDHGLFRGVAKGSRRFSPSAIGRFSGGLELLTSGQVTANIKNPIDLAGIVEWDLHKPRPWFRDNLDLHHAGMFAAQIALAFFPEHQPHPGAFDLLEDALDAMGTADALPSALLKLQWGVALESGLAPSVTLDRNDGPDQRYWLDGQRGTASAIPPDGRPAPRAGRGLDLRGPWPVRRATIEILAQLAEGYEPITPGSNIGPADLARAAKLLAVYLQSVAERPLSLLETVIELLDGKARSHL